MERIDSMRHFTSITQFNDLTKALEAAKYVKENHDVKRNTLPSYPTMKAGVIADCERRLPPMMVSVLKSAIATEKAEKLEESKYINIPASTEGSKAGQKGRK